MSSSAVYEEPTKVSEQPPEIVPRIAVVGCGYWGRNLVRNMRDLEALAMVVDSFPGGRNDASQLAPGVVVTDAYQDALDSVTINGIVVATPAKTHASIVEAALRAGKDVFCEKPLALRYEDGAKLVRLARDHGCILMVGHLLEYHPAIRTLNELVRSERLGKVLYLYSNRLNLGKIRREENILWSFAPHDIAVILRLVGQMPIEVIATGGAYLQPNIADVTVTQLLFDNGVRAHVFVSWLHPFKEQRLVVVGDKNIASFDDVRKELVLHHQHVDLNPNRGPMPVKGEGERVVYSSDEPLRLECMAFLQAIQLRVPPLTDGESGLRVLAVLEAAQQSLFTNGRPVTLTFTRELIDA